MKLYATNSQTGKRLTIKQIKARIEACESAWVKMGETYRDLSAKESLELMSERKQAGNAINRPVCHSRTSDYLPPYEIEDTRFVPPVTQQVRGAKLLEILVATREFANGKTSTVFQP